MTTVSGKPFRNLTLFPWSEVSGACEAQNPPRREEIHDQTVTPYHVSQPYVIETHQNECLWGCDRTFGLFRLGSSSTRKTLAIPSKTHFCDSLKIFEPKYHCHEDIYIYTHICIYIYNYIYIYVVMLILIHPNVSSHADRKKIWTLLWFTPCLPTLRSKNIHIIHSISCYPAHRIP